MSRNADTEYLHRHFKVRFQGTEYWLHDRLISQLEHYDQEGNLLANPFRDISYAIVTDDGDIKRYLQVIGRVEDLEFLD